MTASKLHKLRATVDFAKAHGWIKYPSPRKPGPCINGRSHHFKAGACEICGDFKPAKTVEQTKAT